MNEAYKVGKILTISNVCEKHKVVGYIILFYFIIKRSVAKNLLKLMEQRGAVNKVLTNKS